MPEIKTRSDQPSSMADRVARRLNNSGDVRNADVVTKTGDTARRTFHNIHYGGTAHTHGETNKGEGDISGNKRGVV